MEASQRLPIPFSSYLIPGIIVVLANAFRPPFLIRFGAFAFISSVVLKTLVNCTTGDLGQDYLFGITLGSIMPMLIQYLLLTDTDTELRYKNDPPGVENLSVWGKLRRSLMLLSNPRMVGWTLQVRKICTEPSASRTAFIVGKIRRIAVILIVADICVTYTQLNPIFSHLGPATKGLASQGYLFRALNVIAYGLHPCLAIDFLQSTASIIAVATRISEPEDWPKMFGSFFEAYTLGRFWGMTWHQLLRGPVEAAWRTTNSVLKLRRESKMYYFCKLFLAFTLTGLSHVPGDVMIDVRKTGRSVPFFIAQASGIVLETLFLRAIDRLSLRPSLVVRRVIGYTWVLCWLTITGPYILDWNMEAWMVREPLIPFSPIQTVLGVGKSRELQMFFGNLTPNHTVT